MCKFMDKNIDFIKNFDPEVGTAMQNELFRQRQNLELIASENIVSEKVMAAMGSILTNKYAEGLPGKRYYGGCDFVDDIERVAIKRACDLFGAEHANVQPHSGAQANMAVYFAMLSPNDTVMGMNLSEGGHLTHGCKVNLSGKYYNFISYGVDPTTNLIDYDKLYDTACKEKPKMIVCGASAYSRKIDFKRFREIADACGAYLMVDMAHVAGLVAAGVHESPVPYADFVTTTTHKTLRGPRGGMILCKEKYKKDIDKAVFPGIQGGPLIHIIAAKAVCLLEASTKEFKEYGKNVVLNAKALSEGLIKRGHKIVSGGTDNHLMLLDLRDEKVNGKELEQMLDSVNITVNKNTIPNEQLSPFITSGIRIGTPAVTTRGLNTDDMDLVAELISKIIKDYDNNKKDVKTAVLEILNKYPIY